MDLNRCNLDMDRFRARARELECVSRDLDPSARQERETESEVLE